jgi:hypothetical protein
MLGSVYGSRGRRKRGKGYGVMGNLSAMPPGGRAHRSLEGRAPTAPPTAPMPRGAVGGCSDGGPGRTE